MISLIQRKFREIILDGYIWLYKYQAKRVKPLTHKQWIKFFLIVVGINGSYLIYHQFFEIKLNVASKSLPGTVFILAKNTLPDLNDFTIIHLPKNNRYFANKHLLKIVKGIPGDEIKITNQQLFINNKPMGYLKKRLINGDLLYPLLIQTIPNHYYFIWSPHTDSYDSRYQSVGLISEKQILGKAYEIF